MARDDDDDDTPPRRSPGRTPPRRPRDDEGDDERPQQRRRLKNDDDEDDFDDRPRPKRRPSDDDEQDAPSMIPYKNGKALAAYYCGVFSFIPLLGCILGPIAIILGILGLAHAKKFPKSKGKGHAIAGIVLPIAGYIFWTVIGFVLDIVGK